MKKVLLWIAVPMMVLVIVMIHGHITESTRHKAVMQRLYSVNPKELLAACRVVMANYRSYRPNPNYGGSGYYPDPADPKMPEIIRTIQADGMSMSSNEFGRGEFMQVDIGRDAIIIAYPEGKGPAGNREIGKKIVEGLYYAEDDGVH